MLNILMIINLQLATFN